MCRRDREFWHIRFIQDPRQLEVFEEVTVFNTKVKGDDGFAVDCGFIEKGHFRMDVE